MTERAVSLDALPAFLAPGIDVSRVTELREDMGSDAAVRLFLARWADLVAARVERLAEAIADDDRATALETCASLRVTSAMAGAVVVMGTCSRVERDIVAGALEQAALIMPELREHAARSAQSMRAVLRRFDR